MIEKVYIDEIDMLGNLKFLSKTRDENKDRRNRRTITHYVYQLTSEKMPTNGTAVKLKRLKGSFLL